MPTFLATAALAPRPIAGIGARIDRARRGDTAMAAATVLMPVNARRAARC
jgi:hypothetical protein